MGRPRPNTEKRDFFLGWNLYFLVYFAGNFLVYSLKVVLMAGYLAVFPRKLGKHLDNLKSVQYNPGR